ncbi:MAG: 50S ribosomal protein L17 [Candidatus Zixiibacteriota bacterium]
MGHQDKIAKLGRTKTHREAMLSNMAMSLFLHRMIRTTDAKAKALRPVIDRIIVTAKKNTLASKRQVAEQVHVPEVFKKLYVDILPHFQEKNSGFTRVIKLGVRRGDGAEMSVVELLTPRPVEVAVDKEKKDKEKGGKGFMAKAREAASRKKAPAKKVAKKAAKAK